MKEARQASTEWKGNHFFLTDTRPLESVEIEIRRGARRSAEFPPVFLGLNGVRGSFPGERYEGQVLWTYKDHISTITLNRPVRCPRSHPRSSPELTKVSGMASATARVCPSSSRRVAETHLHRHIHVHIHKHRHVHVRIHNHRPT